MLQKSSHSHSVDHDAESLNWISLADAAISQAQTLEQILRSVVDFAPATLGMDLCCIALSTQHPNELYIAAGNQPTQQCLVGRRFLAESPLACGQCMQTRQPLIVEDVSLRSDVFSVWRDSLGAGSMVYLPLLRGEQPPLGLLILARYRPGPFDSKTLSLSRILATRAAAAIENTRLLNQARIALEGQKHLLAQREMLYSLNTAIYQSATLEEALDRVAQMAPSVMGVDFCGLILMSENPPQASLVAATGRYSQTLTGQHLDLQHDQSLHSFTTCLPVVIPNTRNHSSLHPFWQEFPEIRSIAFLPLFRSDQQPLGLMVLARYHAGEFPREHLNLAADFASRLGSAIDVARLHQQTRRDAETKTMLLRELNHRVKNNLAGITALLSINQPEMSPDARLWLDRAINRIDTMAQAHELFSSGADKVRLADLVRQVLPTLSVIKPGDVRIQTQLDAVNISLHTDRAVSLAMVLHELCYNAILHGLGESGTVIIRAQMIPGSSVKIDVIDGGGGAASKHATSSTGIGLKLVAGLVGRELRGRFALNPGPAGGTVATIEFPLSREELNGDAS